VRLGDFLLGNMEAILSAWEDFARRYWPGESPDILTLRDHAERMLCAVAADMKVPQTAAQQISKSEGGPSGEEGDMNQAAQLHALTRVDDGFDIARLVAEFRALRASVERLWWDSLPEPHPEQMDDMRRFNEAIDQLVCISVESFTNRVERSRRLFLGMLGHDLRQPLASLRMLTEILAANDLPRTEASPLLTRMVGCCDSMAQLLGDLLDFTTSQLGTVMPVQPIALDLGLIAQEVAGDIHTASGQQVLVSREGDLEGTWDKERLRQLISNLISNAIQHGASERPINVTFQGSEDHVTMTVHNHGEPIPREAMATLFDPMVRGAAPPNFRDKKGSIGLGLYIVRQIALAHGGTVEAASSEEGTTFTVQLPRHCQTNAGLKL
jgi:signal transduction histidine kinase